MAAPYWPIPALDCNGDTLLATSGLTGLVALPYFRLALAAPGLRRK